MSSAAPAEASQRRRFAIVVLARWILGGAFVYLGLIKALHPVDFLIMLRQYEVIESHTLLNLIAAALPWSEVVFGLMLLGGIAVRGTALTLLVLLVAFSGMVVSRAWSMHQEMGLPFCAIRFDCGCGAGEVNVCRKLLENAVLALVSVVLLTTRAEAWCARYQLINSREHPV